MLICLGGTNSPTVHEKRTVRSKTAHNAPTIRIFRTVVSPTELKESSSADKRCRPRFENQINWRIFATANGERFDCLQPRNELPYAAN